MPATVDVTVRRVVAVPLPAAVGLIAPVELSAVFRGYGPLPAVVGTSGQVGAWDTPGQTRRVELSDGTSFDEELRSYGEEGFSYLAHSPTGPLRHLVHDARGEWAFASAAGGGTAVRFTYTFRPRPLRRLVVLLGLAPVWRRYTRRSLALVTDLVEAQHAARTRGAGAAPDEAG